MLLFLSGLTLMLAGGVAAAVARATPVASRRAYQSLLMGGCVAAAVPGVRVLATGVPVVASLRAATPGGAWTLRIDVLSAVFLLVVLGVGAACAVVGAYEDEASHSQWGAALSRLGVAVLLAAMALVVAAHAIVVFLIAWEMMAISSYLLIVTQHEDTSVRRAGLVYLVATHTATLALFAMFAMWTSASGASDWSFDALAAGAPSLSSGAAMAVLLLALVGFGFKAGFVPLHFWLPPAHAAAPSHVSALMSGVVIKIGIYGLLRVIVLLGGAPAWWGWLVLALGVVSGVLGVLWALAQHDLKRLLAYHSVENIGIILMGLGVGVLGVAHHSSLIAILGFAAALLHTANHALFKSVLFLAAGAVYRASGTRHLDALGGLARRMPLTWLAFLVGAAAIIGVPPFNGFVSEWLVYQGLFAAGASGSGLGLALIGIPALALIGALALACFAKAAGTVFLGTPRTAAARDAVESGGGSLAPALLLAATCVILGVIPALGLAIVSPASRLLAGDAAAVVPAAVTSGAWTISIVAVATFTLVAALWAAGAILRRRVSVRREPTWGCGYDLPTPRMQYTASSFAAPLLTAFGALSAVRVERSAGALHTHPVDVMLDTVTLPLWRRVHRSALWLRGIQQGRLHFYLLYVMAALLVLLAYLALGPRVS